MAKYESAEALYEALSEQFPVEWVQDFRQGGEDLSYVPWYRYVERLNEIAPLDWSAEVGHLAHVGDYLTMTVTLTIAGARYEQVGIAKAAKDKHKGFGGAAPEAYSQAFRRACAMAGLGLGFYRGEYDDLPEGAELAEEYEEYDGPQPTDAQVERVNNLFDILRKHGREDVVEEARNKVAEAVDRKKVTGIVIRKLKDFVVEQGMVEEGHEEDDPS